jgi:hypothetical protein
MGVVRQGLQPVSWCAAAALAAAVGAVACSSDTTETGSKRGTDVDGGTDARAAITPEPDHAGDGGKTTAPSATSGAPGAGGAGGATATGGAPPVTDGGTGARTPASVPDAAAAPDAATVPVAPIVRGTATTGSAAIVGGSISNAARVVSGMRAGFRNCYNRALTQTPTIAGELTLTLHIGPAGEVASVEPSNLTGTLPDSVVACVEARAQAAQFSAPQADAGSATISFAVTFAVQ